MAKPVLQVRPAALADLARVVDLLVSQYGDHTVKPPRDELANAVEVLLARPELGRILVADENGAVLGLAVISFVWTLEHGGLSAWLDELYVAPERRNDGIGLSLLRSVYDSARSAGAVALDLEVEVGHKRAANLYLREAFRPHARQRYMRRL